MLVEVKVPVLSESVSEAVLSQWHKKVGEFVKRDENLIDLETDKVVLEIPAPDEGVLSEIKKPDGESVTSNEVIAVIDTEAQATSRPTAEVVSLTTSAEKKKEREPVAKERQIVTEKELGPAVRKLVEENNISLEAIEGTGRGGRVTKEDVFKYLEEKKEAVSSPAPEKEPVPVYITGERPEQRVPMSRLRARIAERLKQAQNTAAILTTFNEVNMQPVMDLRARYKDKFQKEYNIKLGFMSFFTKASIEALKKFPVVNSSVDGEDIIYHGYFDIGIAVSTPRGLVVPILRDADKMSFAELEAKTLEFGTAAKNGKLSMEDLMGGTFTITNGGVFGSLLSTPILNPPQSAILGMHKIEERAVVENGQVVVRPMMYLALSYDHRIIDGHEAVLFLVAVKEMLEDPARMLLQI